MELEQLYLDLDGVLADFDRGVEAVCGRPPHRLEVAEMWRALARHGTFFDTLEMMEDALELWDYCQPHDPIILTGLPRGRWAAPQKRSWVARVLGREVEVITTQSARKYRWSGPGRVLVDDRASLREAWEARGGVFVLHTDAPSTIAALGALGI